MMICMEGLLYTFSFFNMHIFFKKSDLAWNKFSHIDENSSNEEIVQGIQSLYLQWWCSVKVEIEDDTIHIYFDENSTNITENEINSIWKLVQRWEFERARKKLTEMIKQDPTNSDLYRLYGQTLSDEWKRDEAEKWLINCLKYNPDNTRWLVMLGNIYNYQWQKELAKTLYQRALTKNDSDIYALSNYGSLCLELEDFAEARKVLKKALNLDPEYWITQYSLGVLEFKEWNELKAFDFALKARKYVDKNNPKTQSIMKLLINISIAQDEKLDIEALYKPLIEELENNLGKKILFQRDDGIKSLAKVKIAENYGMNEHLVLFNPKNHGYKYSIMHELTHLKMVAEARKLGKNKTVYSSRQQKESLINTMRLNSKNVQLMGKYFDSWTDSILTQIYNSPLDLLVENYLYSTYEELRPSQFMFQMGLILQGIEVAQDTETKKKVPTIIFDSNVIMNSILAQQIKDLYGIDKTRDFGHQDLVRIGKKLYDKFDAQKDSMNPWDEYELVKIRSEKLWFLQYITIEDEDLNQTKKSQENTFQEDSLEEIETKVKEIKADSSDINMAVVMYCLAAIRFFRTKTQKEIEMIAYELAVKGGEGIKYGEDSKYHLNTIPWKTFTWYEFLSYMYVAWQILKPEADLGLDYHKEYELAQQLDGQG